MTKIILTKDKIRDLLNQIDEEGKGLTDWEIEFIDSMMKQIDNKYPTEKQIDIINKIIKQRC